MNPRLKKILSRNHSSDLNKLLTEKDIKQEIPLKANKLIDFAYTLPTHKIFVNNKVLHIRR